MRVLLLTQHFFPEVTAGRFRVEAFAQALTARDHDVHVICPVPNHPTGVVDEGYRHGLLLRHEVGGSRVAYVRVITAPRKTVLRRLGYYGSYAALASVVGALGARPDVILASSPPLPVAAAGTILATRHRVPLVLDIRDLWPESAAALGELASGGRLMAAAEGLERWVYRRAARIVTVNDAFRLSIAGRAPPGAAIEVIPNGTTAEWLRIGEVDVSRKSVGLPDDRFIWAYAGNVGLAHGLEVAADAASLLGGEHLLLVIGEGPRRAALERHARALGHSVDLRPLMPPGDAARHLRAADMLLVSERQTQTVSAKLYDMCALGRPVVAACRGELRRVVEEQGIALAVPHGDAEALAGAVGRLRSDPGLRERLCARARRFAEDHRREHHAQRLAQILESVAARR